MEVVGTGNAARVFIAGNFTSLANTINPTTTINQAYLASYNLNTGLIDTQFRPTFGGGGVNAVEASARTAPSSSSAAPSTRWAAWRSRRSPAST